jgi:hypothetical protein
MSTYSPFPYASHLTTPNKDLFYPAVLHFFLKCILIVQEGFALVFQACIYYALIKLTLPPQLLIHSLSPCSNSHQLTVQGIIYR